MAKRRSVIAGQFITHPRQMIESPAWQVLSLTARKALDRIEIEHMDHGGAENGKLPCTYLDFEKWGVHKNYVARALRELEALGFIETTKKGYRGAAGRRQASEYRLTYVTALNAGKRDATGTHDYLKIKTAEEAKAMASAARSGANARNIERGRTHFATLTNCPKPPSQSEGRWRKSGPHKVRAHAHP